MNPLFFVIIFAVLFAIVMIAVSFAYRFLESQRKKQVEGMLDVAAGKEPLETQTTILQEETDEDPLEVIFRKVEFGSGLHRMILQSGVPWTVTRLVVAITIGGVAGATIGYLIRPLGIAWLSMVVFGCLLGSIPYLYLRVKRSKRMAEFEAQLPEALDFLARSMRAGHAFSISLEMLGDESPDPLGQEFRVLFNEQNLGAPIDVALSNFAERVPLLDVRLFVSSVLLQKQTGGNLSEILLRLAYVIRERFRLRGQVKAASAHGRLTAAVLSIMPIVLMFALLFVAPGYLQGMAADETGQWMIVGAIVAQFMGYLIMRKIVNIKV